MPRPAGGGAADRDGPEAGGRGPGAVTGAVGRRSHGAGTCGFGVAALLSSSFPLSVGFGFAGGRELSSEVTITNYRCGRGDRAATAGSFVAVGWAEWLS
ncbi:hypothetical protein GCM10022238_24940 [Gordonia hankookensis]